MGDAQENTQHGENDKDNTGFENTMHSVDKIGTLKMTQSEMKIKLNEKQEIRRNNLQV